MNLLIFLIFACCSLKYFIPGAHTYGLTSFLTRFFYKFADDNEDFARLERAAPTRERRQCDAKSADCNQEQLIHALATLGVVGPDRIISLASEISISQFCGVIEGTLKAVNRNCTPSEPVERKLLKLFDGVEVFNRNLCLSKKAIKMYQRHEPCLVQLREEFKDCEGPSGWFQRSDPYVVCESKKSVLDCFYLKTSDLCGDEAAHFIRCLSRDVFDHVILVDCKNLPKKKPLMMPKAAALTEESAMSGGSRKQRPGSECFWLLLLAAVLSFFADSRN